MDLPVVLKKPNHHRTRAEKRAARGLPTNPAPTPATPPAVYVPWWREKWGDLSCPICLFRIRPKKNVVLPCGHLLHPRCYEGLMGGMHRSACPVCRHPI